MHYQMEDFFNKVTLRRAFWSCVIMVVVYFLITHSYGFQPVPRLPQL